MVHEGDVDSALTYGKKYEWAYNYSLTRQLHAEEFNYEYLNAKHVKVSTVLQSCSCSSHLFLLSHPVFTSHSIPYPIPICHSINTTFTGNRSPYTIPSY